MVQTMALPVGGAVTAELPPAGALGVLYAEHARVRMVLAQLERAAAALERGAPVPRAVFLDMQEFLAVFLNRCHVGKEERVLFPLLVGRGHDALLEVLDAEHGEGQDLAADYAAAVEAYTPGAPATARRLAAIARAYAAFLREHLAREDADLLPLVAAGLAGADPALLAAFTRLERDEVGPGRHARMHRLAAGLAARLDRCLAAPA
ncbi:MAG TPA: hemerythrin domain-containing protein [Thermomicrobiales bacterium]|nr:hemerythrin domain-containing protein [Thermomicrobiales bacterium]